VTSPTIGARLKEQIMPDRRVRSERLFRTMLKDADGGPLCGNGHCMLGVRVPTDIKPDPDGNVHPGTKGMSVTPRDPERLPLHLRPEVFGGVSKLPLFKIEEIDLGERLTYEPDTNRPDRHGVIAPSAVISLADYQSALAATRLAWKELP
jgi:hypothetical protein